VFLYNQACFHELGGRLDEARALLPEAFRARPDLTEWAQQDSDLEALRGGLAALATAGRQAALGRGVSRGGAGAGAGRRERQARDGFEASPGGSRPDVARPVGRRSSGGSIPRRIAGLPAQRPAP
jgi:hypothetical protein